jgi:hypothetical protein
MWRNTVAKPRVAGTADLPQSPNEAAGLRGRFPVNSLLTAGDDSRMLVRTHEKTRPTV